MLFSALLALLPLAPLAAAAPVDLAKRQSYGGRATFYDVGLGACGGYNVASDFIVALNAPQYGGGYPGPNCGRSLTISYGGRSATAVVRDLCPGCGYGDLDMSRGLFNYFASESMGVFQMSWHWNDGNSQPQPAPAPAPAPSPSPAPPPPPPPAPSPSPSPEPQWTPAPAPSPSTTQAPAPAPAPSSSSAAPVIAVAVQSSAESSSASAASSVSSASGSASASVSAPATSASAVAPGSAQVLAAQDNNIAAIASAVINLGRIAVVGANGTDAA